MADQEKTPDQENSPRSRFVAMLARRAGVQASHIEQYFGPWCVMPERFMPLVEQLQGSNVLEHIENRRRSEQHIAQTNAEAEYEMVGTTALLHATGTLTKYGTSYGDETSTVNLRRQIRLAADDDVVRAILLRIESPGGTCAGTQELADDIAAAAAKKPVYAFCEDLCCSAAYWLASQCSKIYANAAALVGCIGTYAVVQDSSGMAEKLGIKVHVVKAGEYKGAGTPGTEVDEKQLEEYQRLVDTLNQFFLDGVAKGRKMAMSAVQKLADGRVHVGQEAFRLGLIDGVKTFEETLDAMEAEASAQRIPGPAASAGANPVSLSPSPSEGTDHMSETQPTGAATLQQLEEALPGVNNDFLVTAMKGGWSASKALTEWTKQLVAENRQLRAAQAAADDEDEDEDEDDLEDESELEEEEAGKKKPKGKKPCAAGDDEPAKPRKAAKPNPKSRRAPGVDPQARSGRRAPPATVQAEFNAAVMQFMKLGHDRRHAVAMVARTQPALHEELLRSDPRNSGGKIQTLIGERFSETFAAN